MCSANENLKKSEITYSDVKEDDWFYADVKDVSENGLMTGTGSDKFSPYENTTRGMIVTIIWRLEGEPQESGGHFSDVDADAYYHDAVSWASVHNIVNGYNEGVFCPEDAMTREQMMAIMYRYAVYKSYDVSKKASLDAFEDKTQISDYAKEAFEWGYANGIISGTSKTTLSPKDNVQRSQVAAIVRRFKAAFSESEKENEPNSSEKSPENEDQKKEVDNKQDGVNSGEQSSGSGRSGNSGSKNTDAVKTTKEPLTEAAQDASSEEEDNSAKIVVGDVTAAAGDHVQIPVEIKNNPGILGLTLTAYYDDTKCTLESITNGEAFEGVLELTASNTLESGARFLWSGLEITKEQVKDGTILLLDFKVAENTEESRIPITLKCLDDDAVDNDLKAVPLQIADGAITVESKK